MSNLTLIRICTVITLVLVGFMGYLAFTLIPEQETVEHEIFVNLEYTTPVVIEIDLSDIDMSELK